MTDVFAGKSAKPSVSRKRVVILSVVTIILVLPWIAWTHFAARHVRQTTVTRMFASALFGGHQPGVNPTSPLQSMLRNFDRPHTQPASGTSADLRRHIAWVETAVWYWERAMWTAAVCLVLAGILAIWTRWSRAILSIAGTLIVVCTIATLACLSALSTPRFGDLPSLSPWTFITIGVLQGGYGLVLVIANTRKP